MLVQCSTNYLSCCVNTIMPVVKRVIKLLVTNRTGLKSGPVLSSFLTMLFCTISLLYSYHSSFISSQVYIKSTLNCLLLSAREIEKVRVICIFTIIILRCYWSDFVRNHFIATWGREISLLSSI